MKKFLTNFGVASFSNSKMKKIAMLLLLVGAPLFAQNNFQKGRIITINQDTIQAEIGMYSWLRQ